MTRNTKIAFGAAAAALVLGIGSYELGRKTTEPVPVVPQAQTVPAQTYPVSSSPSNTYNPTLPEQPAPAPAPVAATTTTTTSTVKSANVPTPFPGVVPPAGYVPPTTTTTQVTSPSSALQSERAQLAPMPAATSVSSTTSTDSTTTHTAYVAPTHKAYVHTQVKHHSAGKIHVARATKHAVMFAVKMPGRLRL